MGISAEKIAPRPLARSLLAWYDRHRRDLPWRAKPGETADPYRVWLSEIMLQQTGVATVGPYFRAFVARWPTVAKLAEAPLDDVLHAWQGLGYYARARNLAATAALIAGPHRGRFPESAEALRELPGIGPYTAAAISAIAFDGRACAVDGNVERVVTRLFALRAPRPEAKRQARLLAAELTPNRRVGDFWQAMMDLGAGVCTPRNPDCEKCPLRAPCRARALGLAAQLPRPPSRVKRPRRQGVAFWLTRADGAVLLRRREPRGLLGGMMEMPSTPWRSAPWSRGEALRHAPAPARWQALAGSIRHTFTHFDLELSLLTARVRRANAVAGEWCLPERFGELALPTVMKKLARFAIEQTPVS